MICNIMTTDLAQGSIDFFGDEKLVGMETRSSREMIGKNANLKCFIDIL